MSYTKEVLILLNFLLAGMTYQNYVSEHLSGTLAGNNVCTRYTNGTASRHNFMQQLGERGRQLNQNNYAQILFSRFVDVLSL
jgi:hypothetical protein